MNKDIFEKENEGINMNNCRQPKTLQYLEKLVKLPTVLFTIRQELDYL